MTDSISADLGEALQMAQLVMALGEVNRATKHPDGRPETDTTHTVMLALVVARVAGREDIPLDRERALLFAIVHDLVEADAGDTNTIRPLSAEGREAKATREAAALERIRRDLPWVGQLVDEYERQDTPEARFVRYIDKIMPRLTHFWNGLQTVHDAGMDLAELKEKHREQGAELVRRYPELTYAHQLFEAACLACELLYVEPDDDRTEARHGRRGWRRRAERPMSRPAARKPVWFHGRLAELLPAHAVDFDPELLETDEDLVEDLAGLDLEDQLEILLDASEPLKRT